MFTKNIKDTFTTNLLNAVSGVLSEAKKKKCSEGCECEACEKEEAKEGYVPTNDMPDAHSRKVAGKLAALLKREREAKEKREPLGVKEEVELDESRFSRIWAGDYTAKSEKSQFGGHRPHVVDKNGKTMYLSQHSYKNPETAKKHAETYLNAYASVGPRHAENATIDFARINKKHLHVNESIDPDLESELKATRVSAENKAKWHVTRHGKVLSTHTSKDVADVKAMKHPSNKVRMAEEIDEAFEQIDEISKATMGRYINKAKDQVDAASWRSGYRAAKPNDPNSQAIINAKEKQLSKRHGGIELAVKKLTKEEAEQIDELSDTTLKSYAKKAMDQATSAHGYQKDAEKAGDHETARREMKHKWKRQAGARNAIDRLGNNTLAKEEAEQIDELSKGTMGRYINKAATKMGSQGVTAGLKIAADEKSSKNFKDMDKREKGIKLAVSKLTKEESEQIDELSRGTLVNYIHKAVHTAMKTSDTTPEGKVKREKRLKGAGLASKKLGYNEETELDEAGERKAWKRSEGIGKAVSKLTKEEQDFIDSLNDADMDLIDEARGRPKKAAAKDFTIHPVTKEKLMHNNPEHMAKIEKLQKHGVLVKPKTEANQHIINQLQRAKTSMRGGETVHFTHGESQHVSDTHASRILDKYAGLKPNEKEAFQKKVGHSHDNLKSEL